MSMWKKCIGFATGVGLLLMILFVPAVSQAQQAAGSLAELAVDIWPDFDRPEVLILFTGRVAADIPLPATVTLPLPPEAELNAVARITNDNLMVDDIEFTPGADSVTLVTPDARFRVEFYMPYEQDGDERQFTYRWLATDLNVAQLIATIQEPAAADSMTVTPEAETISIGSDGLTYHNMAPLAVPAGEPYSVAVTYTADSDLLTESVLQVDEPPPAIVEPPAGEESAAINWPLILAVVGGVLVVAVVGWQVLSRRQTRPAARKPRPGTRGKTRKQTGKGKKPAGSSMAPAADTGKVNFCHQCGERAQSGDKFCRNCGTALKGN